MEAISIDSAPIAADWLRHQAYSSPDKPALIYKEQSWNYRQLDEQSDRLSGRLAAYRIGFNDAVGVLLPNRPEFVFLVHALRRIGAVMVPLNTRLLPKELGWQIEQAGCSALVYSNETQAAAEKIQAQGLTHLNLDEPAEIEKARRPANNSPAASGQQPGQAQAIVFTSGTTGQAKGAVLTYSNHFWSAVGSAFRLGVEARDRWLVCLPLYHVGGLAVIFRSSLYGTSLVLQNGFEPQAVLNAIATQGITMLSLVPTMLHRLLELPEAAETLGTLRCILLGGAAAAPGLLERSREAGLPLALTYGMTETASQFATATPEQTRRKPGSVGKPLLFCQARIVDENGMDLPAGEIGQVFVSGPSLMAGYSPGGGELVNLGEFETGDLGYVDDEDDLWIVQRRTDLIVSGGENIYPIEIENVLLSHPGVESACVVGIPHPEWGQQAVAAVSAKPGCILDPEILLGLCRERLAGYKIPRRVFILERLPHTETGKIARRQVGELLTKMIEVV